MLDERFAKGNSPLHGCDPRAKIIAACCYIAVVAVAERIDVTLAALGVSLILLLTARLEPGAVLKRLAAANSFTLFLWLTLPFTYGGPELTRLGPLPVSAGGVHIATLISLKTNVIVMAFLALLSTSPIVSIGHGLAALKVPRRLTFLLLFAYRYVFVIYEEYSKLRRAAMMRSFVPATNIHTYRTYGYLFGMTLVRSWNRSQRVYQAMLLRGFNGVLIPLEQSSLKVGDFLFPGGVVLVSLLLLGCRLFSL